LLPFGDRSLKSQLKAADKAGVAYAVIVGEGELQSGQWTVRTLADSSQQTVARADLIDWLAQRR
jgi:histidyl-tRNA synthetase